MIAIKNLSYAYDKKAPLILNNINLNIQQGEFVAIIGQNGAGKTTLLKQLNGLLKPNTGSVLINELNTATTKTSILAKHIGYLFQNPDHQIFCNTVYDEIKFGLVNIKCEPEKIEGKIKAIASLLGLENKLSKNPFTLSRGERQRVALASVLVLETDILVLDEPTTGQDYKECIEIMDIVKGLNEKGKTIIMVSHDIEGVSDHTQRVIILRNGGVLEDGPTRQVLKHQENLMLAGLEPPQIIQLALRFGDLFDGAFSVEEIFEIIKQKCRA
ncbi:MAG: energy-coupling factor ABC transporter ATP-binding protein [Clostridia bacterium]|nr:energy-coupling factor ABC transporter ATP-binding protein [Clostridia bacterium]